MLWSGGGGEEGEEEKQEMSTKEMPQERVKELSNFFHQRLRTRSCAEDLLLLSMLKRPGEAHKRLLNTMLAGDAPKGGSCLASHLEIQAS